MTPLNDINIGIIGEHIAIADLMMHGHPVFATSQGMNYDLVLQAGDRLLKIQVKTTRTFRQMSHRAKPIYFFHIKRTGKNGAKHYQKGDFDAYALVALDRKLVFYLPFSEAKHSSICVRDRDIDYRSGQGAIAANASGQGIYFQDLTLERMLQNTK